MSSGLNQIEAALDPLEPTFETVHAAHQDRHVLFDIGRTRLQFEKFINNPIELRVDASKHHKNAAVGFIGHMLQILVPKLFRKQRPGTRSAGWKS